MAIFPPYSMRAPMDWVNVFGEKLLEWYAADFFGVSWSKSFVGWNFHGCWFAGFHGWERFVYGFQHPAFADDDKFGLVDFAFLVKVFFFAGLLVCGVEDLVGFLDFRSIINQYKVAFL